MKLYTSDIDTKSAFYKNCKRQRAREAKICQDCPFRKPLKKMEAQLNAWNTSKKDS